MYNFREYSDSYTKTFEVLWQYCRDVPAVDVNGAIGDFNAANATKRSFKIETKTIGQTGDDGSKNCSKNETIKIFK